MTHDGPAIRVTRPTFASPAEAARLDEAMRLHPRRAGESLLRYVERLAIAGGVMDARDAVAPALPATREPGMEG